MKSNIQHINNASAKRLLSPPELYNYHRRAASKPLIGEHLKQLQLEVESDDQQSIEEFHGS